MANGNGDPSTYSNIQQVLGLALIFIRIGMEVYRFLYKQHETSKALLSHSAQHDKDKERSDTS